MVFCMVHIFLPEVVEINVEIAVDLLLLWFVPGLLGFVFHRQYSLSVFTLDCDHGIPNCHVVTCKAVLSRNQTSGFEWFKFSRTWCGMVAQIFKG